MNIKKHIDSEILKMYVLGQANELEIKEIEILRIKYPEIEQEIEKIELELENYAQENAIAPHPSLKPLVMATFDYLQRLESGEQASVTPILNENSRIEDFKPWIDREDMIAPTDFENIHVKILTASPGFTSAIVWIKEQAADETHTDEYEKFFILEGTCTIAVGTKEHKLVSGDYFAIPLHENHKVIVTSKTPCKVILQRIAA